MDPKEKKEFAAYLIDQILEYFITDCFDCPIEDSCSIGNLNSEENCSSALWEFFEVRYGMGNEKG